MKRTSKRAGEANGFTIIGIVVVVIVLGSCVAIVGYVAGWFGEAARVAQEEFGPEEALRKYEWFKDAAAQLEKKQADIEVFQARITSQNEAYEGVPRKDWPRDEREQRSIWESEVAGVKASYNQLAAEYNAQMAKFNWQFANVGDLPEGAEEPLPREFKSYTTH